MLAWAKSLLLVGCGILVGISTVEAAEIDDYQRSFDLYRQAYSKYEIQKNDFVSSQTFASEEALVGSAQEMLLLRADSWSNYWKTLSSRYNSVEAGEEHLKKEWSGFFDTEYAWLNAHKERLNQQKTRIGMLGEATELNSKYEAYMSQAFRLNVETVSGKLRDGINQLRQLNQALLDRAKNQEIEINKKEIAIRGFEVNLDRLNQTETDLLIIRQDFMDEAGFVDKEQFLSINQDFLPIYQKMSQSMSLTRELSKDIQW